MAYPFNLSYLAVWQNTFVPLGEMGADITFGLLMFSV